MRKSLAHPGLINSSYVVFFHLFCIGWAIYLSTYFPPVLRQTAIAINILLPIALFWFIYFIRQLGNHDHILRLFLGYYCISAVMSFFSAVIGPVTEGELPVIRIIFFGPYLYAGSFMSFIYISVLLFYGYLTYIAAVMSASISEILYTNIVSRRLPSQIQTLLNRADKQIDGTAMRVSDKYFFMNQTSGLILTSGVIALMSAGFVILILTQAYN